MDKVIVLIVNWNTGKLLKECLEALLQLPERGLVAGIYVADNASSDDSLRLASEAAGDRVRFLALKENAGFARANNLLWEQARQEGFRDSHVLLLNPDTRVRPGSVKTLVELLQRRPRAGVVGPKLLNLDGSLQPSVRRLPNLGAFMGLALKLHYWGRPAWRRRYMAEDFDYGKEQMAEQVMGAAFLIRNQAAAEVGWLDERFWVWFEEVDYCKRILDKGWQVWFTPAAQVIHAGGVSFGQINGLKRGRPWLRSMRYYARKHWGAGAEMVMWALTPLALGLVLLAGYQRKRISKFKAA